MKVSFKVSEIKNYAGELEITQISDWVVDSEGEKVLVQNLNDAAPTYASHGRQNAQLWGEIASEPEACGGSFNCYDYLPSGTAIRASNTLEFKVRVRGVGCPHGHFQR